MIDYVKKLVMTIPTVEANSFVNRGNRAHTPTIYGFHFETAPAGSSRPDELCVYVCAEQEKHAYIGLGWALGLTFGVE